MYREWNIGFIICKLWIILMWFNLQQFYIHVSTENMDYNNNNNNNPKNIQEGNFAQWYEELKNSGLKYADSIYCEPWSTNMSQDLDSGLRSCSGTNFKMNNVGLNVAYQMHITDQHAVKLIVGKNLIAENLFTTNDIYQSSVVNGNDSIVKFISFRNSGIQVTVTLSELNVFPVFEDVAYQGVNDIILNALPGTYAFRQKQPLLKIADKFCRYPLPSRYLLSLKAFRRRQTFGYKRECKSKSQRNTTFCLANSHMEYPDNEEEKIHFYERSINDQCGRNQAAFLPHDPNSFYCTHDTPLINEIFGEYVQEQIVKSDLSSCSEYKKLCMICLNHTNENNKQTDSRCYVQDNKLEKFPGINAGHIRSEGKFADLPCCGISCYNTPACLAYYSPVCQSEVDKKITLEDKICMDGNTYHISIIPEFDFQKGVFMCHLKKTNYSLGFRFKLSIDLFKLIHQKSFQRQVFKETELSIESEHEIKSLDPYDLNIDALRIEIPNTKSEENTYDSLKDIILLGRRNETLQDFQFSIHQIPKSTNIQDYKPPVERALHTDSAFTTIQSSKPHAFSSVNWKNEGCDLNVYENILPTKEFSDFLAKGQPVDIYAISNTNRNAINSVLSQGDNVYLDKPHSFRLNNKQTSLPSVNIKLSGNNSILRPIFCNKKNPLIKYNLLANTEQESFGKYRIFRKSVKVSVKFTKNSLGQDIFNILVTGHVTGTPTYLNFKLVWIANYFVLSNHDILVISSQSKSSYLESSKTEQFQLTYQIDLKSIRGIPYDKLSFLLSTQSIVLFDLIIQDCDTNVTVRIPNAYINQQTVDKMLHENTFQSSLVGVQLNKSVDKESTQWIIYSPLLFITIGIGLLYFLVLITFVCIKHFIISNKGYPISVGYQKFVDNSNNDQSSDFQYHQLLLHPFPVKLNNHTLFYATSRKGEDYIQTFLPGRQTLYHPTIVPSHRHCCQDVTKDGKSHSTWLHQNAWNTKSSKLKRIFLFTHLAFRVFYTFLFTFSVAVSLIFSLQPSSRPTFDSMIHWPKVSQESLDYNHRMQRNMHRSSSSSVTSMPTIHLDQTHLIGPIIRLQTEARWIEEFTEQELKRQLDYVERMKLACQHAMTVEITDALREGKHLVKTRLDKWQLNTTIAQNTDNINGNTLVSTNELAGHHFNKQRSLFDQIYEQVSQQIDFRRVKSFKVYSNMLNSVFHSGWLQYAKRMLNTSDNLDRTPKHFSNAKIHSATKLHFQDSMRRFYEIAQQRSGIKASYVTLMNYMNFYQSDSVQLLPLRLLESLKKIFAPANHYITMFYLSSEVHDQLRQSQIKHQSNHQTINLKNPFLHKTRQERVFVTTNDLEEYIDGTLNPIEDAITRHSPNQEYKLISENFIEYIKRNANGNSEDYIKYSDQHSAIPVMTLTHIRLSLLILDCLIIVYRFFHTYEILKAIWTGQKLFVDASSWLERQVNVMSSENKDIGYFHEESEQITGNFKSRLCATERGRNSSHSDHTAYNETDSKLFSRTTIFQCLPQYQNRYECRHDRQALFQSSCSPSVPRNSQSSETVSPIMSNNIMQSQCTDKSKENFQPCPTYSQLSNMPCKSLPYNSLISIGPPLSLPPTSSFGIEQNTGCMLGVRTACCRKSHYISSIVGLTVLILLFGLVLIQMYKPTGVISKKSSTSTNYLKQNFIQYRGNRIPYLSTQINFFRPYHELLIREHSKRLNRDWLGWTRRNELAMRGRVLSYLSRFKYELAFFDKQVEAENSVIQSLLFQNKKSSSSASSTSTAKSDKDFSKPVQYPTSPVFNSEFLFRQQICHFLPVVPVPIIDDDTELNSKDMSPSLRGMTKPQNIKQIIWTATISTFVDFDWNSQEQANRLFITAIIVGVVMISCIGVVDLGGKILKMLYINPAVSLSDIQRWRSNQKLTHEKELRNYDQNTENIILISPQPAPIIPWPSDLLFNVNGKLKTTPSKSNPTCRQTSSPGSSVSILKEPEAQLPLTAFYLDSNLVFTPTSTPQIYNTSKPIQLDDVSHSIPLLIAHSPSSTPIIALKTDPLSSTNQLSGVLYEKT